MGKHKMTTIYCSKKFGDFLGTEKFTTAEALPENKFGNWNGHLFFYARQKHLMLTNNKSYYVLIFTGIKKVDLKDFESLFVQRLIDQLVYDNIIDNSDALLIREKLLPIQFARTNNDKKAIGTLNEFIFQFKVQCDYSDMENQSVTYINSKLNDTLVGAGRPEKGNYGRPIEDMKALINASI